MRRRWIITLLLTPLLLALVALAVYRCHTVPLSQCSEVYQRYHDTPGIRASFIKNKPINDTLNVDMTLLVADDSLTFVNLLKGWGKSEEYIHDLMKSRIDERTRFIRRAPIGHPELPPDADDSKNELVAVFPVQNSVAFFHFENEEQLNLTYDAVLFEEVDI
jgi:hypothetical protein